MQMPTAESSNILIKAIAWRHLTTGVRCAGLGLCEIAGVADGEAVDATILKAAGDTGVAEAEWQTLVSRCKYESWCSISCGTHSRISKKPPNAVGLAKWSHAPHIPCRAAAPSPPWSVAATCIMKHIL